jgi:thiosulfate dehydrogenase [quinone] large subunit
MSQDKTVSHVDQVFIVFFRLTMGWTFLWAGIHHFGDDKFVLGFLSHVKTFHAPFAVMLMLLYWTAHMDFPYIENVNSYLVDYHIVYAGVLIYLVAKHAGHVFGLDGLVSKLAAVQHSPALRWAVA